MSNIVALDYKNKTEFVFTFLMPVLKAVWQTERFSDEWDLIEDICETTSYRISRPLFNDGFILKQKWNLTKTTAENDTIILSVQIVSGLSHIDMDLIKGSLQEDGIINALLSVTYTDQYNNIVAL